MVSFMLKVLLVATFILIIIMIWNRLYYEIYLGRGIKILNKQLKKATRDEVKMFTKELHSILNQVINEVTDSYEETVEYVTEEKK